MVMVLKLAITYKMFEWSIFNVLIISEGHSIFIVLVFCNNFFIHTHTHLSINQVSWIMFSQAFFGSVTLLDSFHERKWVRILTPPHAVRCEIPRGYLRRSFVLLNLFRVESRGTRSRHLVYRSWKHKHDFMPKMTSLELGLDVRYVLRKC